MKVLVTGAAGFIGYHVARQLLDRGDEVVGLDNFNPYYDPALKRARLERLASPGFRLLEGDLVDRETVEAAFAFEPHAVVHLAAQAGVRYSLTHPQAYVDSNVTGTLNVLEACRHRAVGHLVYASSSSVYGANTHMPFAVEDKVDRPISLYGATKKANELMAHAYSHLFAIPATGLRFFTVYGPWGRPDMAMFLFTERILAGKPIPVFNDGDMERDFTYIDDIATGVVRVLEAPPKDDVPYRLYNIGNHAPVRLLDLVAVLEDALGAKATVELLPMQPGDVKATYADISDLERDVGFAPSTPIEVGVRRFVEWYREYYGV